MAPRKYIEKNMMMGYKQMFGEKPSTKVQSPLEKGDHPDRTGLPPQTWLLALMYVCFVLNFTASASLNWRTPMEILTGSTPYISPLLSFHWWEPVYFKLDDASFPSN
jgi:hypothetical protein